MTVEPGRYTALVSQPGFLVDLLLQSGVDRFETLYCYGVSSRVLHRLPRRAARIAIQSCMTVHQLPVSLLEADQSIVIVEYDDLIFSALEGEDRDVVFAVGRQFQGPTSSKAVLVWASGGARRQSPVPDRRSGHLALRRATGDVDGSDEAKAAGADDPRVAGEVGH
ncbi:MAG: hypothetical protein ABFC38_11745 [Methanospirillum sp.]